MLARGAAVLAAGTLGQWALRSLLRQALRPPSARRSPTPDRKALPVRRAELAAEGGYAVSETVVMRRVTVHR